MGTKFGTEHLQAYFGPTYLLVDCMVLVDNFGPADVVLEGTGKLKVGGALQLDRA